MADENTPDLQDRLSTFSQKNKTKRRGGNIGVGALAIALALGGGGAAYFLATNLQERAKGLETSDVETFQDQRTGNIAADDPESDKADGQGGVGERDADEAQYQNDGEAG